MPYEIKESNKCGDDKPFGVFLKDGGKLLGCHATEEAANSQISAIESKASELDSVIHYLTANLDEEIADSAIAHIMRLLDDVKPDSKGVDMVDDDLKAVKIPDDIGVDDAEMYRKTYAKFHSKCLEGKNPKPQKCAEGADKAARAAIKFAKSVDAELGAKALNSLLTQAQTIHDSCASLGACTSASDDTDEESKAGRRNSASDYGHLKGIHDISVEMGAKCMDGKALSDDLDENIRMIRNAWYDKFDPGRKTDAYVDKYFIDKVIVEVRGKLSEYPYAYVGDELVFGKPFPVKLVYQRIDGEAPKPKRLSEDLNTAPVKAKHGHQQTDSDDLGYELEVSLVEAKAACLSGDNSLKALYETEDELVCGNYIVLFGGRDLEGLASHRKNGDGSTGEYFTAKTVLESSYTQINHLLIDWEHGRRLNSVEPGRDDVLGYVDWKSAEWDEEGVFVRQVLNRRNKYIKFIEHLIREGMIGTSSEPVQSNVQKSSDGEIQVWPLKRQALTVVPMDYRMMDKNTLEVMKSLNVDIYGLQKRRIAVEDFLLTLGESKHTGEAMSM